MELKCDKIVSKLLSPDQKLRNKEWYIDWKNLTQTPSFLERVITNPGSTSTILILKPKARSGKQKMVLEQKKALKKSWWLFLFDVCGIVHHEFFPEEQTVNGNFYVEVLKKCNKNATKFGRGR